MNKNRTTQIVGAIAEILILLCLVVMFLAGNDIWHDTGRPDFWHLTKPPFADVRVFVCAYYVLAALVLGRMLIRLGKSATESLLKKQQATSGASEPQ